MFQIYRFYSKDNRLLYVGCSANPLGSRLISHRATSPWFNEVSRIEVSKKMSKAEALDREGEAIRAESPKYNLNKRKRKIVKEPNNLYFKWMRDMESRREEIVRLKSEGWTNGDLAIRFGISRQRVWQLVKQP